VATYRTSRPLLVEATRCTAPMTVVTDLGERVGHAGDWIISGEDNERYRLLPIWRCWKAGSPSDSLREPTGIALSEQKSRRK
jgi:hypothetical protein